MKKKIEFVWRLALTPFYVAGIAWASIFVLLVEGKAEFKEFWRTNT